jgi:putative ABC transport system substrate-binding protein
MNVDVIVTTGSPAIRPAFDATRTIPIVMIAGSADPVGDGFAVSLARPNGNVTGVTWSAGPELVGKNLEILKAFIPRLLRVALLYDAAVSPTTARAWQDAAHRAGVSIELLMVRHPDELERSIIAASRGGADAMYVVLGGLNYSYRQRITALALARRLPTFSTLRELPEAGGLMSYGPSLSDLYRRGAIYVDKILRGAKPGDLPIEQPTRFELVLNLKAAKALGLVVPQSLVLQADHLVE